MLKFLIPFYENLPSYTSVVRLQFLFVWDIQCTMDTIFCLMVTFHP